VKFDSDMCTRAAHHSLLIERLNLGDSPATFLTAFGPIVIVLSG